MKILLFLFILLSLNFQSHIQTPLENQKSGILDTELILKKMPVFNDKDENILFTLKFRVDADIKELKKIVLHFTGESDLTLVTEVSALISTNGKNIFGKTDKLAGLTEIEGSYLLKRGQNSIQFNFSAESIPKFEIYEEEYPLDALYSVDVSKVSVEDIMEKVFRIELVKP